jgi:hypothetical protein
MELVIEILRDLPGTIFGIVCGVSFWLLFQMKKDKKTLKEEQSLRLFAKAEEPKVKKQLELSFTPPPIPAPEENPTAISSDQTSAAIPALKGNI